MGENEYKDIGDEIKNVVQDALNSGDLSRLNNDIRSSVTSAMREIRDELKINIGGDYGKNFMPNDEKLREKFAGMKQAGGSESRSYGTGAARQSGTYGRTFYNTSSGGRVYRASDARQTGTTSGVYVQPRRTTEIVPADPRVNPKGQVSGIVLSSLGGVGIVSGIITTGIFAGLANLTHLGLFNGLQSISAVLLGGGIWSLLAGIGNLKMFRRVKTYFSMAKGSGYAKISDMAKTVGKSAKFVAKDIYRMISRGMLPQGHIDDSSTYFMLDDDTHKMYLDMKKSQLERVAEQQGAFGGEQTRESTDGKSESADLGKLDEETRKVVLEGRAYIKQINDANDAIPGEEISKKLDRLSTVMERIFAFVVEHPEKVDSIRKFMSYYLPTTLKLVNAYRDFDVQPIQGENITKAKEEIENTLDTINDAFANMLDDMYEDTTMDISTDIDVLQTLLAQDGLTK